MNVNNRNRGEEMSYESEVPKRLTQSEKTNFFGKTAKQISVKSCGSNNSLHPPIIKLLNERKTAFEKFYGFDELFEIFDEINNNWHKLNEYNPRTSNMIKYLKIK